MRVCVDYRELNKVTENDVYQMPRVDDLVERMGKAAYISTLDLSKGYYQVPLRPEDRPKTAFASQAGKYQFTKMPFGLKGAPSTFQRLMDVVLAPCAQFASAYIDDITATFGPGPAVSPKCWPYSKATQVLPGDNILLISWTQGWWRKSSAGGSESGSHSRF